MKTYLLFFVFFITCIKANESVDPSYYERLIIPQVFNTTRFLNHFQKCLMGGGVCTFVGKELKVLKDIQDYISTSCKKDFDLAYPSEFGSLVLPELLNSNRYMNHLQKCLLGEGKCISEEKELKQHLPNIFLTKCKKCTAAQKLNLKKFIEHLKTKKPKFWEDVKKKFDPSGKYTDNILTDPDFLGSI